MALGGGRRGVSRSYRFGVTVNVVLICVLATVLALGLVWFVRRMSYSYDLRYDLTRDGRYEVHPLSKKLLRRVEVPVRATFIWGFDQDIHNRVRDPVTGRPRAELLRRFYLPVLRRIESRVSRVLAEWARICPVLEWEVVWQQGNPQRAEVLAGDLGVKVPDVLNEVVLTLEGRRRTVPVERLVDVAWGHFHPADPNQSRPPFIRGHWRVQAELTAALRALLIGEKTVVAVPQGVSARFGPGGEAFAALKDDLGKGGYELRGFSPGEGGVPEEAAVVLLPGVQRPLDAAATRTFREHEEEGGRLMILADPRYPEDYSWLLEPYGLELRPALVKDPSNASPQLGRPEEIQSDRLVGLGSQVAAPLHRRLPIYVGKARPIQVSKDRAPGVDGRVMLQASRGARAVPVEYPEGGREWVTVPGLEEPMPGAYLAMEVWRPLPEKETQARLVLFGSSDVLSPAAVGTGSLGNRDLLINALEWLADRPANIGILPREDERAVIDPVQRVHAPVTWVAVVGLPLLALAAAVVCYFMRRS